MNDCRHVEALIDRRAGGLGDDEHALLDRHLSHCGRCGWSANAMQQVTDVIERGPVPLSEAARERALAGAFARAAIAGPMIDMPSGAPANTTSLATRSPMHRRLIAGATIAVAAAALVALIRVAAPEHGEPITRPSPGASQVVAKAAAEPAVLALATEARQEAPAVVDDGWIEAREEAQHGFGHARVVLAANTRVRFTSDVNTLELARGQVRVDVDARPHVGFAVVTQNFRVEVLGTQFSVTPERVDVQHGKVRVRDAGGRTLARLRAGQSYRHVAGADSTTVREPSKRASRSDAPTGAELLRRARTALAHDDVKGAKALLAEVARQGSLSPAERAEGTTLEAECALLEHDRATAIRHYLVVAERYGTLAAGENALFAAAQLRAKQGDDGEARALFARYLERYPRGRFAAEARAQLLRAGATR